MTEIKPVMMGKQDFESPDEMLLVALSQSFEFL